MKTVIAGVHDDQISYARNLWYLPSTIPPTPTFGIKGHRFMIKSEYTRTSRAASFKWFFQATPFDRLGNILRIKEVEGLISFVMDLYIPYANLLGTVSL
ncbi:MAG: hypothetical protein HY445_03345 [Candidatus Niyogibacteria bacterium]|nr:hypothetical protein [Candidatus Niyogibacteria bacterium]